MNGKTGKEKLKKTSETEAESPEQLVIQSRPVIGRATSMGGLVEEAKKQEDPKVSGEPASAPILPVQSKRTVIVPISEDSAEEPAPSNETSTADTAPEAPSAPQKEASPKAEAAPAKTEAATTKATDTPAKAANEEPKEEDVPEDEAATDKKDEKPNPETEKAIAEAAAAAKRDKELESLIDSKQFNVPINAVAHKREVKHSALMTVAILLLGLILIDLMLDSGIVLLAEKIPHTHFFTISGSN